MKKQYLLAGGAGLALAAAGSAHAQSVDYGSLQQLFNEPVTTSATGTPQRSTEAPADMQIISADEIRQSGETNLPGILQRAAGLDVTMWSAGQADVNVRGYDQPNSSRLLVLVNGRQVYQDDNGYTNWSAIPVQLDEIRQIEVVKGPNTALFGFNAVSGVVNIITYNPKYDDVNEVKLGGGNIGQRMASGFVTLKLSPMLSVRVSAGAGHEDQWTPNGSLPTQANLHDAEHVETNIDAVAQLTAKTELRVEGSWSNIQQDTLSGTQYAINKSDTKSIKATITSETPIGVVQASAYQNDLDATYYLSGADTWKNTITVADIQDLFKIGTSNTFRIGGEYRHNEINTVVVGGGKVFYDDWSGSGMWNWGISPQLTSTLAIRVDDLDLGRTGSFPTGMLLASNSYWDREIVSDSENYTLAWRPTDVDTFRASFGRGIQAPTLIDLSIQFPVQTSPFPIYYGGNPDLKPSRVDNFELAYDHSFSFAKFGARAFYQIWKDLKTETGNHTDILISSSPLSVDVLPTNVANSKETGLEFTASSQIHKDLTLHGDVTFTHVQDKSIEAGVDPVSNYVAFHATTPAARGNVGLTWTHGPWEVDTNVHYVSDYKGFGLTNGTATAVSVLTPVKAFAAVSARVGYKFKNGVVVAVSGQNLFDNHQQQTIGLPAETAVQFTISKSW